MKGSKKTFNKILNALLHLDISDLALLIEASASCAIEGNETGNICVSVVRRILFNAATAEDFFEEELLTTLHIIEGISNVNQDR